MPLTWDLSKCRDHHELVGPECTDEQWEMTKALIFETIPVGIDEITEKNAEEFWFRSTTHRVLDGWPCFTLDEIKRYVGLRTNASRKTRTEWRTQIVNGFWSDLKGVALGKRTKHNVKFYTQQEQETEEVTP